MREFNFIINESLVKGISPDKRSLRGTEFLSDAYNLKTSPYGLKEFEPILDPFQGSFPVSFPHPQLFETASERLLVDKDGVYSVDSSITPWQYSKIDLKDLTGSSVDPTINGSWFFVPIDDSWILVNGESFVMKDSSGLLRNVSDRHICVNDFSVNTACHHRGRVVLGGFSPDNFWRGKWQDLIKDIISSNSESVNIPFNEVDESYVFWSSIGGGDFPLWFIRPELAIHGPMDDAGNFGYNMDRLDTMMLYESLIKNQFGYMPMDWNGEVLGVCSLQDKVIVFGNNGVTGLFAVNEDISTYGKRNISQEGIASKNAFCGDGEKILYVSSLGDLRVISGELQEENLGYENSLKQMLGSDIIITKNVVDEYFITNGLKSFMWTPQGLTRVSHHPTSVIKVGSESYGLFENDNDSSALVVTETHDLGLRALKTINSINLGVLEGSDVEVAVDYRYDRKGDFTRSQFVPVNKEGNAYVRVTCVDFRIIVRSSTFTNFELDQIDVRYQVPDKRQIRGRYASRNAS